MDEVKIGQQMVDQVFINRNKSSRFYDRLSKEVHFLNKEAKNSSSKLYDDIISGLSIDETGMVEASTNNLSHITELMNGVNDIQNKYRVAFHGLINSSREEMMEILVDRETRVDKLMKKVGVEEDRVNLTYDSFKIMEEINVYSLVLVNHMIDKWKNTVYDLYYAGVFGNRKPLEFKQVFFNSSGSLKIGSSLEGESEVISSVALTQQRTAFLREKAKEQGYKYCWNANPMDQRTKEECVAASLAGVITEGEMGTDYGFPPRYVCRCELVYTREEWTDVNAGINMALEERRKGLVQELVEAPRQKSSWMRAGVRVVPSDAGRASGKKMYKEIESKLKYAVKHPVPEIGVQNA